MLLGAHGCGTVATHYPGCAHETGVCAYTGVCVCDQRLQRALARSFAGGNRARRSGEGRGGDAGQMNDEDRLGEIDDLLGGLDAGDGGSMRLVRAERAHARAPFAACPTSE